MVNGQMQVMSVMQPGRTNPIGWIAPKGGASDIAGGLTFIGTLLQTMQGGADSAATPNALAMPHGMSGLLFSGEPEQGKKASGDILLQWLEGVEGAARVKGAEEVEGAESQEIDIETLESLMSLLEVAQAVIDQWKPSNRQPTDADADVSSQRSFADASGLAVEKPYEKLVTTMRQLVSLLNEKPAQPEIVQLVQSFEQLIQGKTKPAAHPNAAAMELLKRAHAVQGAPVGADFKGRLEVLAAKAGIHTAIITAMNEEEEAGAKPALSAPYSSTAIDESELTIAAGYPSRSMIEPQPQSQAGNPNPIVHANRFAEEMAKLLQQMKLSSAEGLSEVRLTLMPEHLGHVDVKVSMQDGHVIAQLTANTAHGKEMLESQLSQLRGMLQTQGLQVDRLEVTQSSSQFAGMFQDSRQQRSSQQFEREGKSRRIEVEQASAEFVDELESVASDIPRQGDHSFDVTA